MDDEKALDWIGLLVPMLRHDVKTAVLSHEVMEAQNAIVPPGLEGFHTEFVNTYHAIQNALVLKLAMDVARVFDFSAGRRIDQQDMASIPVLAMLFRTGAVRDRLAQNAAKWLSGVECIGDIDDNPLKEFDDVARDLALDHRDSDSDACLSAIDGFIALSDRLLDASSNEALALARVKAFRNRRLAHALFNKEPDEYPKYADLTLLLEIAKKAAALSSLAVEGLNTDFEDQTARNRANAEGFAKCVVDGLKSSL